MIILTYFFNFELIKLRLEIINNNNNLARDWMNCRLVEELKLSRPQDHKN